MLEIMNPLFFGILFLGFFITLITGLSIYFRQKTMGSKVLAFFLLSASLWSIFYFFEVMTLEKDWKKILFYSKYIFISLIPVLFLQFTYEFIGTNKKKRIRLHGILLLILIIILPLVWTNELHGLVISDFTFYDNNGLTYIAFERGPLHYLIDLVLISMMMIGTFTFLKLALRSEKETRIHVTIILSALWVPLIGVFLEILEIHPFNIVDTAPLLFIFSGSVIAFGLLKFDLFFIDSLSRTMMIDQISEGIISLDPSGDIIDINRKAKEILDINSPYGGKKSLSTINRSFSEALIRMKELDQSSFEIELGRKGTVYDVKSSDIRDKNGKLIGNLILMQDISIRKETEIKLLEKEGELKEANEILSVINKILRHDLTNDLMAIKIAKGAFEITGDKNLLKNMDGSVNRSISLIRRMKEVESSMKEGKGLQPMNLGSILKEDGKRFPVLVKVNGNGSVMADKAIHSIIQNLITNSMKHGYATEIEFTIIDSGDSYSLIIKDNGKGMDKKIIDHAMDEGFSSGKNKGSGLGLFIVRKTMERYSGNARLVPSDGNGFELILEFCKA